MIAPVDQSDLDAIAQLTPPGWTQMDQVFASYLKNPCAKAIKIIERNELAGVGASIHMEHSAWLAHIVVHPAFRRQGIGGKIVDFLCQELERDGIQTISLLATELGEPVYLRSGFSTVGSYEFLTLPEVLKEGRCVLKPFAPENLQSILDLDLDYSGELRAGLLEPHLSSALLVFEANELVGYYMPGWGEGHIVAKTLNAALSLLSIRSEEKRTVCLPLANETLRRFLLEKGAKSEGKYIVRMERGTPLKWNAAWCCARIAGKLG